jgi:hypothetical protein
MPQNLIAATMTDAQREALLADLAAFDAKWGPFKVNLGPDQIGNIAKLSPSDIGLLEIALTFVQQNAGSISADQGAALLAQDVALARQAIIVDAAAQQKAAMTRNTLIAIMSDAFVVANGIYRVEKAKGKNPQNEAFLEAYGAHFARGPQEPPAPPANPNP